MKSLGFPIFFCMLGGMATPLAGQSYRAADSLVSAGDTAGAIRVYERMLRRHGNDAEAHYRLGALLFSRVALGANVSQDRRQAEEHLRLATRYEPDSAQYWLALADLFRSQTDVTSRIQVAPSLERALSAARRQGGQILGEVEYRNGRLAWERYEHESNRYRLTGPIDDIDYNAFLNDWSYVEELFGRYLRREARGLLEWRQAEEHLQAALRATPDNLEAAGLLIVALIEMERTDSAVALGEALRRRQPTAGRAWALLGLALARAERWRDADAAFDSAEQHLLPEDRLPYRQLALIEPPDWVEDSDDPVGYWTRADPLWLLPGNEVRAEFYARVTYADYRWGDPLRGYRGWESERGAVYVRYGPPDRVATLGAGGPASDHVVLRGADRGPERFDAAARLDRARNQILWVYYATEQRYVFGLTPGYARDAFAASARHSFVQDQRRNPTTNENIPLVVALAPITVDAAQFRGEAPQTNDIAVFGLFRAPPPDGARSVALARSDVDGVAAESAAPISENGRERTWRLTVSPGAYVVRVESVDTASRWYGRGQMDLPVRRFDGGTLAVSDVVLATRLEPGDSVSRWFDFGITPVPPSGIWRPTISLLWEVYGLQVSDRGTARYRVEVQITAESIRRHGIVATVIGGIGDALGLTAEGEDAVALQYERTPRTSVGEAVVEYLTVELGGDVPDGTYRINVRVTDAGSGESAVVERTLIVAVPGR